jgi:hypothetical protein
MFIGLTLERLICVMLGTKHLRKCQAGRVSGRKLILNLLSSIASVQTDDCWRRNLAHNPNPAPELQKICSGITHNWSIVLPAGISSSIQNKRDSSGPNKALLIAVFKRIAYRNGAEAY